MSAIATCEWSPQAVEVLRYVRALYAPPPALTVSEYADESLVVVSGPLAGTRWQTSFAPYQRGIMDAFHEEGVEVVVVMGSSQWGKTSTALNIVAYHCDYDPCPIMVVEPTVEPMAKDFSTNRLQPLIDASPRLSETFSRRRQKDGSNTTLLKTFRGGYIAIGGANSAASLAARAVRLLVLDEVNRYPPELPGEGDTVSIAIKRTTAYRNRRRILMMSSPTLVGGTIETWHARGDQRRWYVPCPACEHRHPYEWQNVRWEGGRGGRPDTAHLHCPECDFAIDDAMRVALLAKGEWRAENPDRVDKTIVSFHVWGAYSPLESLRDIVAGFLKAHGEMRAGNRAEMHTWQNTTLGEPVEPTAGEGAEPDPLFARREVYPPGIDVPDGAAVLTMGVDVQDDRLELLIYGWGAGEEAWLVDRQLLAGDTSKPAPWAALDEVLEHGYVHASGHRLHVASTCIDSAGHRTTEVYDFVARKAGRRVFATIGRDGQRPIVSSPTMRQWGRQVRKVPLYTIGVDTAKSLIMPRLLVTEPGPGYVHFPRDEWADPELFEQLTSEVLVKRFTHGIPTTFWRKRRPRNEALDCSVLALAALRLLHPNLEAIAQALSATAPDGTPVGPGPRASRPGRRVSRSPYLG
ncbi:MAG: phage terminase large subunit family protein [Vicinamibacterales bacterium]